MCMDKVAYRLYKFSRITQHDFCPLPFLRKYVGGGGGRGI